MIKGLVLVLLFIGFWILFNHLSVLSQLSELMKKTRLEMDAASRQRNLAERKNLLALQRKYTVWYAMEQMLHYSGLKRRFPGVTVENWILIHISAGTALFLAISFLFGFSMGVLVVLSGLSAEWLALRVMRWINYKKTEENLTKLLDFLGNYSLSAGEITSVLGQVSRYMEEPIKGALDSCYYEATTTGDSGMALLTMAECMEHPKFKEIARSMEISLRYCADFSLLVESSRRSLREYMRYTQERRGLLREAGISLALLVGMSIIALFMVGRLLGSTRGI